MGLAFVGAGDRTQFAVLPMAKIIERRCQAVGGGAHSHRIQMGSSPFNLPKN